MKHLYLICLILVGCNGCNQSAQQESHQNSSIGGKSRLEQVKDLPYRNMNLAEAVEQEIRKDFSEVLKMLDLENKDQFFWKSDANEIYEVEHNRTSANGLINFAYNFWENDSVRYTWVALLSESVNADTEEADTNIVNLIEHKDLTGTIHLFIDSSLDLESIEISYQERN